MIRVSSWDALSFLRHGILAALVVSGLSCACPQEPPTEVKPPPRPTAEEETASVISLIKPPHAPSDAPPKLQAAAESVFSRTFAPLIATRVISRAQLPTCTGNGCLFDVVYADRCAQLAADALFTSRRTPLSFEWPGPVTRTPPIAVKGPNGGLGPNVSVTWAFFISPSQYPLLDKIPNPDSPPPPPVPPCAMTGRPTGVAAPSTNDTAAPTPPEAK